MLVLATSADIPLMREMRTREYLESIKWMKENIQDKNVIFLETILKSNSFIEDYYSVIYSNCHVKEYFNQGSNHGLSLKRFFELYEVPDDELIIQTTARYSFIDTYFFDYIDKNPGFDFYGRLSGGPQYFTGCFALTCKYLKEWVNTTDWKLLNDHHINFEKSLYDFLQGSTAKINHMSKINMKCNIFGKGNPSLHIM